MKKLVKKELAKLLAKKMTKEDSFKNTVKKLSQEILEETKEETKEPSKEPSKVPSKGLSKKAKRNEELVNYKSGVNDSIIKNMTSTVDNNDIEKIKVIMEKGDSLVHEYNVISNSASSPIESYFSVPHITKSMEAEKKYSEEDKEKIKEICFKELGDVSNITLTDHKKVVISSDKDSKNYIKNYTITNTKNKFSFKCSYLYNYETKNTTFKNLDISLMCNLEDVEQNVKIKNEELGIEFLIKTSEILNVFDFKNGELEIPRIKNEPKKTISKNPKAKTVRKSKAKVTT